MEGLGLRVQGLGSLLVGFRALGLGFKGGFRVDDISTFTLRRLDELTGV